MTMMTTLLRFLQLCAIISSVSLTDWAASAFSVTSTQPQRTLSSRLQAHTDDKLEHIDRNNDSSRRNLLLTSLGLSLGLSTASSPAWAATSPKVLVLGGTGLVGSRVVAILQAQGVPVVATSRNGRDGTVALDFTQTVGADLASSIANLARDCTAVISCVGAIGSGKDELVNAATGTVAVAAKQAGVERFVYITVAPEVVEFGKDIGALQSYMAGKVYSRDVVLSTFPGASSTLIEPTFIYGGNAFGINPPRVAGFYGQFIEGVLSSSPFRGLEGAMPPGFVKIALEPPVSADNVASAAVAGALGKGTAPILDTHDKITEAAAALAD